MSCNHINYLKLLLYVVVISSIFLHNIWFFNSFLQWLMTKKKPVPIKAVHMRYVLPGYSNRTHLTYMYKNIQKNWWKRLFLMRAVIVYVWFGDVIWRNSEFHVNSFVVWFINDVRRIFVLSIRERITNPWWVGGHDTKFLFCGLRFIKW